MYTEGGTIRCYLAQISETLCSVRRCTAASCTAVILHVVSQRQSRQKSKTLVPQDTRSDYRRLVCTNSSDLRESACRDLSFQRDHHHPLSSVTHFDRTNLTSSSPFHGYRTECR